MKFRFRIPSLKKSIAARNSPTRIIKNGLGLREPRGFGWITNPKKALYNHVYNRTTFGVDDILREGSKKGGCLSIILICSLMVGLTSWTI